MEILKRFSILLSIAVIIGFIIGLIRGIYHITIHRYIHYKMYRLVALTLSLQEQINKDVLLSIILFAALLFIALIIWLIWKLFISRAVEVRIDIKKPDTLLAVIVCFLFLLCGGWAINHYWLPAWNSPLSLLGDLGIALFTLLLGWMLIKAKWNQIFKITEVISLFLFISMVILNLGVFIDTKINAPKGPNVFLISIDTLRADHLGCYGYNLNTSPYIDEFAKDSVQFKNAKSQMPFTKASHSSLFTSLYPSSLNIIYDIYGSLLNEGYLTLAEILRNYGYATAAFTVGGPTSNKLGFGQGFQIYKDKPPSNVTAIFNIHGLDWIKRQKGRFFIFLHCYEPHAPYDPPMHFKEEFAARHTPILQLSNRHYDFASAGDESDAAIKQWWRTQDQTFLNTIIGLYDGEIKYVDSEINKLFIELKRIGVFDNSIIILLSDHGEAFSEHHSFGHHQTLYEEELHIPLIIHMPKEMAQYNRKSVNNLVGLIDVMPTILDICQIPYPTRFQGTSLLKLIKEDAFSRNVLFSEDLYRDVYTAAVSTSEYKYIMKGSHEELYDLVNDPKESNNLLGTDATKREFGQISFRFKEILHKQLKENEAYAKEAKKVMKNINKVSLDNETKRQLKALGYAQ